MSNNIKITYLFRLKNGETREIPLLLDENTLALVSEIKNAPPFWSELTFHQCSVCPLDPGLHPIAPSP